MATKKTSRREPRLAPGQPGGREYPGQEYRVLVLTKTKDTADVTEYTVKRHGRFRKYVQHHDVLSTLKKLAPKKSTTAVAITKAGTVHIAARSRKIVRVDKVSQKIARAAVKSAGRHRANDGTLFFQLKKH